MALRTAAWSTPVDADGDVGGGHACCSSRVAGTASRLGGVAGEGEEDLVEARLAEREARATRDAGPASSPTAAAPPSASAQATDSAAGSALERHRRRAAAAAPAAAAGRCAGSTQPDVQRAGADRGLELRRGALGDDPAVVDDGDAVGELVGLLEVLRAEQHRGALGDERPDDLPHLVAGARVEPGRRLVEEHQLGGDDEAGGDVEPAAHAAGVVLDQPAAGAGEPEGVEQLVGARLRGGPPAGRAAGPSSTRFSQPVRSSSTEASWPVRLTRPRTAAASVTTSWPSTRALPASGRISVASMRMVVVLPAPLGRARRRRSRGGPRGRRCRPPASRRTTWPGRSPRRRGTRSRAWCLLSGPETGPVALQTGAAAGTHRQAPSQSPVAPSP